MEYIFSIWKIINHFIRSLQQYNLGRVELNKRGKEQNLKKCAIVGIAGTSQAPAENWLRVGNPGQAGATPGDPYKRVSFP
jgi:hypothetical protein